MSEVTKPILKDETGVSMVSALGAIASAIEHSAEAQISALNSDLSAEISARQAIDGQLQAAVSALNSDKADKVSGATNGNFAALDSNGNLKDSGNKASDFLTSHQDISGKADLTVIAPAFDDTETYYVDAMVTYNGKLYQFAFAHLPNSGWDSSKVTEIDVGTWLRTTAMRQGLDYVTAGQKANTTLGDNATAEGFNTTASGDDCHAEGGSTTASGVRSHAEGDYTTASGNYSHAEGSYTTASGSCSHAGGEGTKATKQNQTVIGKFNDAETFTTASANGEYAFQIGNGTSDNARSNALGVKWDGTLEASGDIEDGHGNVLNEMFWKGTSSEWTALPAATKAKYAGKPVYLTDDAGVYTGMPQPYRFTLTGTGSTVTTTFSHASVTADMRVIDSTISNPSAVLSDMTITPANGSLTVSATVNGTTEVLLIMQPCRSVIDLT